MDVIDSFAMGSIPRYTALKDYADLDVMVVLHYGKHVKNRQPEQVLSAVKSAFGSGAGSVRRNGQAVTIKMASWPDVDIVPAVRVADADGKVTGYEIPDMNRGAWLSTNPPLHTRQMIAAAAERGPNFRRVVTMLKDWNRRQEVRLQSYHIEVIALKLQTDWRDHSWPLLKWFQEAQSAVNWCWYANSDVSGYLPYDRAARAITQLRETELKALDAWSASYGQDDKRAIAGWKSVFGQRFPSYG